MVDKINPSVKHISPFKQGYLILLLPYRPKNAVHPLHTWCMLWFRFTTYLFCKLNTLERRWIRKRAASQRQVWKRRRIMGELCDDQPPGNSHKKRIKIQHNSTTKHNAHSFLTLIETKGGDQRKGIPFRITKTTCWASSTTLLSPVHFTL